MRIHRIVARSKLTSSPLLIEAASLITCVYSVFRLNTVHPVTVALKSDGVRTKAVPGSVCGIRHVISTIRQQPLQPLLALLVASFMLGAIPMLLTAIYSAVRALADLYRHAFQTRTSADQTIAFHSEEKPSTGRAAANSCGSCPAELIDLMGVISRLTAEV